MYYCVYLYKIVDVHVKNRWNSQFIYKTRQVHVHARIKGKLQKKRRKQPFIKAVFCGLIRT